MFDKLEMVFAAASSSGDLSELVVGLDEQTLADLIAQHEQALTRLADFKLILAAAWADRHSGGTGQSLLAERAIKVGGSGTPAVNEGGVDEYGDLSSVSNGSARRLLGDVLDVRHRMPRLWFRVCRAGVRDWQARKIAQATRPLTVEAAKVVDARLDPWVGQLSWGRLSTLLDAEILSADPDRAADLAAEAEEAMGVWSGSTNERGVKSVYARTDPVSAAWFLGMVNRIADLLAVDGDGRSSDRRRAAAIGILARLADAIALLARHSVGGACPSTSSGNDEATSSGTKDEPVTTMPEPVTTMPKPVEGSCFEPDPDLDEACVAEYRPTGHPDEHPEFAPPRESDAMCDCNPDPPIFTGVSIPSNADLKASRPKVVLHFHVSDTGVVRDGGRALVRPGQAEQFDPATLSELTTWLSGTGCKVIVQPVIDPAETAPADAYEIPDRIRAVVRYRDIADIGPWGTSTSKSLDLDHTRSYRSSGPPGQTNPDNLAPMVRPVHRVKTVGKKRLRQPEPGAYLWRSHHGHITLVTNRGSINLGRSMFARAVWSAAAGARVARPTGADAVELAA